MTFQYFGSNEGSSSGDPELGMLGIRSYTFLEEDRRVWFVYYCFPFTLSFGCLINKKMPGRVVGGLRWVGELA